MSEKVIQEFRVVETDDGFRIELKGDKEALRRMFLGSFGPFARHFRHHGFGVHGHEEHHEHEHHAHRPPWAEKGKRHGGRKHRGYDLGPWWDESESATENA